MIYSEIIEIPLKGTGCTLMLTRRELMNNLPDSIIIRGLERGKAIQRHRQRKERMSKRYEKQQVKGV